MIVLERCTIDYDGDVVPPIMQGAARSNGGDVLISEFDKVQRRMRQADRLTEATVSAPDKRDNSVQVTGYSEYLIEMVGVPREEAQVTVKCTPVPE